MSFLSTLTDQQRDAVGSVLQEQSYNEGDVIVKQDDRSDALYVIKEGVCQAYVKHKKELQGRRMAIMKSGAIFGESSLTDEKATRKYTVVADSQATIFKLERKAFVELLGDLKDLVKQNFTLKVLASMEMFKHLSKTQQAVRYPARPLDAGGRTPTAQCRLHRINPDKFCCLCRTRRRARRCTR